MSETGPSFEDLAVQQGLITPQQLEECRRVREKVAGDGLEVTVEEVLLKKGYLTKPQAQAVHAALGKGIKTAIEGYDVLSKLGQGGMGAVYKARQSSMDRIVAIKVLLPKYAKEKDGVDRFVREARAVARLNHPNIVSGIDAGVSNGIYYYVMEFVDGETLSQALAKRRTIPWKESVTILKQVASALDHAHRNGLIHRDVKPGNVLLAKDGTVKLMDLGMARFAAHGNMDLTHSGTIMGTPFYMSPEQARGEELDIRTDLYALGISLYEMLTGKPPFTGETPLVVLNKHIQEPLKFEVKDVPAAVLAVGRRLTEKDRARRHPTPAELLKDLEAIEEGRPVAHVPALVLGGGRSAGVEGPAPLQRAPTRRMRTVRVQGKSQAPLFIGIAAAVVVVAGLVLMLSGSKPEPAPPSKPVAAPPKKPAHRTSLDRQLEEEKPLSAADQAALAGLKAARAYERDNPEDIEEIAAQYAALAPKAAKTAYADRVKQRAEETSALLAQAVERRKKHVREQMTNGNPLDALARHERDFKAAEWKEWIGRERTAAENAAAAGRAKAREDEAAARAKAVESLATPPKPFEVVPARPPPDPAAAQKVEAFLDQAERLAGQRQYDRIEAAAPKPPPEEARLHLEFYKAAAELVAGARAGAAARQGQPVQFEMKNGQKVSGGVEASDGMGILVAGKAYAVHEMAGPSLAAFYRLQRKATPKNEALVTVALYDGNLAAADAILKQGPIALPSRLEKIHQRMTAERDADLLLKEAAKLKDDAAAAKLTEILEKHPDTKAAETARKRMESMVKEIVVYAGDLPADSVQDDFKLFDRDGVPGGKIAGTADDQEGFFPPPEES